MFVQPVNVNDDRLLTFKPRIGRPKLESAPPTDQHGFTNLFRRNTLTAVDGKAVDKYGFLYHQPESQSERKLHELWLARRKQEAFEWKAQQQIDLVMNRLSLKKSRLESNSLRRQEVNTFMSMRSTRKDDVAPTHDEANKKNVRYAPVNHNNRDDRGRQLANLNDIYSHLKPLDLEIKSPSSKTTRSIIDREMKEQKDGDGSEMVSGSQSLHESSRAQINAGDSKASVTSAFEGFGVTAEKVIARYCN